MLDFLIFLIAVLIFLLIVKILYYFNSINILSLIQNQTTEKFLIDAETDEYETKRQEEIESAKIKFDTLEDLQKKLSNEEYVKYLSSNYPLMYTYYVKTKKINRMLAFIIIGIIVFYIISMWITIYYYKNKKRDSTVQKEVEKTNEKLKKIGKYLKAENTKIQTKYNALKKQYVELQLKENKKQKISRNIQKTKTQITAPQVAKTKIDANREQPQPEPKKQKRENVETDEESEKNTEEEDEENQETEKTQAQTNNDIITTQDLLDNEKIESL